MHARAENSTASLSPAACAYRSVKMEERDKTMKESSLPKDEPQNDENSKDKNELPVQPLVARRDW
jgi:hypothetical protein